MKQRRKFIKYDVDGYSVKRRFRREIDSSVTFKTGFQVKLIPFAMDVDHEFFVIFMVQRREAANLYIWVEFGRKGHTGSSCRFTTICELMKYSKWTFQSMDVSGHFPAKKVNKALEFLLELPDAEILERLEAFETYLKNIGGSEYWKKYDEIILQNVEKARKEYKGLLYMY